MKERIPFDKDTNNSKVCFNNILLTKEINNLEEKISQTSQI